MAAQLRHLEKRVRQLEAALLAITTAGASTPSTLPRRPRVTSTLTDDVTVSPGAPEALDPARASDALAAALAYVARDFSVIPLVPGTKRPAVKLAPFLDGSQRMSDADVRAYWSQNPQAGIAIVTGVPSGLVVVDVDPRNGGSVEAVLEKSCRTGMATCTGGGGTHFFLRHPGTHVPCGKTALPGVDRKGDGGYVVAPPTLHPNGERYYWRELTGEPGELPGWVLERPTATSPAGEDRGQWVADTIANPQAVVAGTQEDTLTRLAWWAAGHLPYDIALGLLVTWTSQLPLGNISDPWTHEQVKDRLDRAVVRRKDEFPVNFVGGPTSGLSAVTGGRKRGLTSEAAIAAVVAACRSAHARSLDHEPQVEWIVPLLLPRGVLVDLHGDPKAGKSTLLAHLVRAVLLGGEFFGQKVTKTKVIWFTEQPRPTFAPLLHAAGLHAHPDLLVLHHHEVLGHEWPDRVTGLVKVAKQQEAAVLIIDTFTKLAGVRGEDENKAGSMLTALDELEAAKAAGLAVVLVRHDRKSRGGVIDAGRGSNAVAGEADIIYQLVREAKDAPNVRRLRYEGRLGEIPLERRIALEGREYQLLGTPAEMAARAAEAAKWTDWELLASVAPDAPEDAIPGIELAKRVKEHFGRDKAMARLAEYRELTDECGPFPGMLVWEGEDGRSRYWRICACRMESVSCGTCERCTNGEPCTTWRLVTDPACPGHDYTRAQGRQVLPDPPTLEI
jgi:hypothetical protein